MTDKLNHINSQSELNPEIEVIISGASIAWDKSSEDYWNEMQEKIDNPGLAKHNLKPLRLKVMQYAAAASVAILLGIGAIMFLYTVKVITPANQQAQVLLPDNSKVTVYPESSLSYKPLIWKYYRMVKFEGEGVFKVQKGEKFVVASEIGKTVVLGTKFHVFANRDTYNVACISGKVKVVEAVYSNDTIITRGQKAILRPDKKFDIHQLQSSDEQFDAEKSKTIEEPIQKRPAIQARMQPNIEPTDISISTKQKIKGQIVKEIAKEDVKERIINEKQFAKENTDADKIARASSGKQLSESSSAVRTENASQTSILKPQGSQARINATQQSNDVFYSSLSPEQISILENQQLSREERRAAFLESLSPQQQQMFNDLNEERRSRRNTRRSEVARTDNTNEQQNNLTGEQTMPNVPEENREINGEPPSRELFDPRHDEIPINPPNLDHKPPPPPGDYPDHGEPPPQGDHLSPPPSDEILDEPYSEPPPREPLDDHHPLPELEPDHNDPPPPDQNPGDLPEDEEPQRDSGRGRNR